MAQGPSHRSAIAAAASAPLNLQSAPGAHERIDIEARLGSSI
jgi:hypothetical protein